MNFCTYDMLVQAMHRNAALRQTADYVQGVSLLEESCEVLYLGKCFEVNSRETRDLVDTINRIYYKHCFKDLAAQLDELNIRYQLYGDSFEVDGFAFDCEIERKFGDVKLAIEKLKELTTMNLLYEDDVMSEIKLAWRRAHARNLIPELERNNIAYSFGYQYMSVENVPYDYMYKLQDRVRSAIKEITEYRNCIR